MTNGSAVISQWRETLLFVHSWITDLKARTRFFSAKAFFVFYALNFACFWWAMLTARADIFMMKPTEYGLMSFPVAAMGAAFDVFSLGITLWAVDRALNARSNVVYFAFIGVDLVLAFVAMCWVVFAFVFSGWLVGFILPLNETLADRADLYNHRFWYIFQDPLAQESLKNVYFGTVMGASALLPTLAHVSVAVWSFALWTGRAITARSSA